MTHPSDIEVKVTEFEIFFFLGETSTVESCFLWVFVVPGAPEGSTGRLIFVVVFFFILEKPGIKPATSGLQGE